LGLQVALVVLGGSEDQEEGDVIISIVVLVFRAWRLIRIVHGVFEGVEDVKEKELV